jgi:uncharacterized protein YecT (DUF1311 family)
MRKILITLTMCFCVCLAGCQKAQEAAEDAEPLTQADSPVTNPTNKELEAVKTPCDDAADGAEAENCAKGEFEKTEGELTTLYQKLLTDFQNFEKKAQAQDKELAESYKRNAENLQVSQKAWTAYRDANCKAEKESDTNDGNNTFTDLNCRQRMTEDRVEDLKLIYENK